MDEYIADPAPDPDVDALIESMAHLRSAQIALRPVLIRMEEKRRVRIAVRKSRAKQSDLPARNRKIA